MMEYKGKYKIFDAGKIKTYPLSERKNKVSIKQMVNPADIANRSFKVAEEVKEHISKIAKNIKEARKQNQPVILFAGAHLIKNGLGLLVIDLMKRGLLTLVAGNAATAIHDFELALAGETSEDVPDALEKGKFGMAEEFSLHNLALKLEPRIPPKIKKGERSFKASTPF